MIIIKTANGDRFINEAEKEFTKLTKALQTQTELADRYKEANERIMKRNLWERIISKKTYL